MRCRCSIVNCWHGTGIRWYQMLIIIVGPDYEVLCPATWACRISFRCSRPFTHPIWGGGRSRPRGLQIFLPFLHPSLLGNLPDIGPETSNSCEWGNQRSAWENVFDCEYRWRLWIWGLRALIWIWFYASLFELHIKVLRALVSSQVASRARMHYSVFPFTIVMRSIGGSEVSLIVQTLCKQGIAVNMYAHEDVWTWATASLHGHPTKFEPISWLQGWLWIQKRWTFESSCSLTHQGTHVGNPGFPISMALPSFLGLMVELTGCFEFNNIHHISRSTYSLHFLEKSWISISQESKASDVKHYVTDVIPFRSPRHHEKNIYRIVHKRPLGHALLIKLLGAAKVCTNWWTLVLPSRIRCLLNLKWYWILNSLEEI